MSLAVDISVAPEVSDDLPANTDFEAWLVAALNGRADAAELSLRIVGEEEGRQLNQRYRNRDYATNVLSFPAESLTGVTPQPLGDLVLCAPVVQREAQEQGKSLAAHWAHLCVHGALHLVGFDHEQEDEARAMEGLEVEILARMGYQDPYRAKA